MLAPAGLDPAPLRDAHLRCRAAFSLACSPAVLEAVRGALGEDVLVWRSILLPKPPRSGRRWAADWHQDSEFWDIAPDFGVSAWIALEDAGPSSGCLEALPGSHGRSLPHVAAEGSRFDRRAEPPQGAPVTLPCRAGEFVLFDGRLLHRSRPNRSDRPFAAFSVRYQRPSARFTRPADPACVLLSGTAQGSGLRFVLPPGAPADPQLVSSRHGR